MIIFTSRNLHIETMSKMFVFLWFINVHYVVNHESHALVFIINNTHLNTSISVYVRVIFCFLAIFIWLWLLGPVFRCTLQIEVFRIETIFFYFIFSIFTGVIIPWYFMSFLWKSTSIVGPIRVKLTSKSGPQSVNVSVSLWLKCYLYQIKTQKRATLYTLFYGSLSLSLLTPETKSCN